MSSGRCVHWLLSHHTILAVGIPGFIFPIFFLIITMYIGDPFIFHMYRIIHSIYSTYFPLKKTYLKTKGQSWPGSQLRFWVPPGSGVSRPGHYGGVGERQWRRRCRGEVSRRLWVHQKIAEDYGDYGDYLY